MDGRDDLEAVCRERLETFRIKELKDVLHRLGLPKQGKKQVLRDKIMAVFAPGERQAGVRGRTPGKEDAARIIADIYRKLQGPAAPDLATGRPAASSSPRSEEPDNEVIVEKNETRCPCGNPSELGTMIQCDDQNCSIWQHISCVVIPEKVEDATVPVPTQFYCELCRIARGDPFCVSLGNPLLPTKLSGSAPKIEGSHVMQNVERVFRISRSERELITKPNHDLQVWCVLLNDKVPFRMHWPTYADLRINGMQVRVTTRPGQQLLGLNGRDEGPGIATLLKDGDNRFSLWSNDARQFCVGIRIIRRLTMAQVLEKIPDVSGGENIDEALGRVRRAVTGGAAEAADGEDDDLVVLDSITVNLRCPLSSSRIKTAGRFRPCAHMGCFDLETLVGINQRARKWQCPICLKNFSLEHLIIDPFFNRVASAMRGYSEEVTEVEMKADGFWRPKLEGDAGARELWRTPEGSFVQSNGAAKNATAQPDFVTVKVEEGLSSHGGLRPPNIKLKRSRDGQWAWNGAKRVNGVTSHNVIGPSHQKPTVITRSTSATASNVNVGNGDDERSVNQEPSDGSGDANGGVRPSAVHTSGPFDTGRSMAIAGSNDPGDVIVLSDSDDDDDILVNYSGAQAVGGDLGMTRRSPEVLSDEIRGEPDLAPDRTGLSLGAIPILQPYRQVNPLSPVGAQLVSSPAGGNSASGFLPLDKNNGFWNGPVHTFVFTGASDTGPSNVNQLTQPLRPTPLQAVEGANYGLSSQANGRSFSVGGVGTGSPIRHSSYDRNFGGENSGRGSPTESPLHIFLPPQPARAVETTLREPVLPEDDEINNSWFSLSLGPDMSMEATLPGTAAPAPVPEATSQARGHLDTLTTTANVLLGMTSRDSATSVEPMTSLHRSFVHPTQRRSSSNSVRHRRYYRIETDSD